MSTNDFQDPLVNEQSGKAARAASTKMTEKHIVAAIMRLLKQRTYCFAWKEHGGQYGTAGIPDIIVCCHGMFVAFEVKTETGKLTKLQETTLRRINAAKGHAYKVTSAAQVAAILDELEGDIYE
ncbi:MAG TPA: VRR-NUC domain-containing protein [Candidatus Limiplasma sp.]|nr:VRR-NUC domain-containing protein [Candidatus Limiplasma sp.]